MKKRLLLKSGITLEFDDLYFTRTAEESMRINEIMEGRLIFASGMCEAAG